LDSEGEDLENSDSEASSVSGGSHADIKALAKRKRISTEKASKKKISKAAVIPITRGRITKRK
jgi:hypothetical protein